MVQYLQYTYTIHIEKGRVLMKGGNVQVSISSNVCVKPIAVLGFFISGIYLNVICLLERSLDSNATACLEAHTSTITKLLPKCVLFQISVRSRAGSVGVTLLILNLGLMLKTTFHR